MDAIKGCYGKSILKTCDWRVQTRFFWLRIGSSGGHLWRRRRLVGLYTTWINVWLGGTVSFSRSTQRLSCFVTMPFFTCEFELCVYGFMCLIIVNSSLGNEKRVV